MHIIKSQECRGCSHNIFKVEVGATYRKIHYLKPNTTILRICACVANVCAFMHDNGLTNLEVVFSDVLR